MKKKMTLLEAIRHLEAHEGLRSTLLSTGALSPNVFTYAEIYKHYQFVFKELKHKKEKSFRGKAVERTAEHFKISTRSVYSAIAKFE